MTSGRPSPTEQAVLDGMSPSMRELATICGWIGKGKEEEDAGKLFAAEESYDTASEGLRNYLADIRCSRATGALYDFAIEQRERVKLIRLTK